MWAIKRERKERESEGTLHPSSMSGGVNGNFVTWLAHASMVPHRTTFRDLGTRPLGAASPSCRSSSCDSKYFISGASAHHTGCILIKEYRDARVELIWLSIAAMEENPLHC